MSESVEEKYKALITQEYLKLQTRLGEKFNGMYIANQTSKKLPDGTITVPSSIDINALAHAICADSQGTICYYDCVEHSVGKVNITILYPSKI